VTLIIENLVKKFPKENTELTAIENFNLVVKDEEFVCILGPSGCGKTTILRIIAGLETKTSGSVRLDDREITGPGQDRGMVFQEFALFPWRTVQKNVEFGLEIKKVPKEERTRIANDFITLVGLKGFENSYPYQLSGGMKQSGDRSCARK
jgi:NitT/TauT family transport system ATP-binding protein